MNLDKDPSSWARINPVIVANWHPTEVQNFVAMALGDIAKLAAEVERLNKWADGFSDAQLKERRLCEERIKELQASRERLKSAVEFAHSEGFQWPSDPMAEFVSG